MSATPAPEMIDKIVERFRALGDASRVRLLLHLKSGERNVAELSAAIGLAQPSVSKHLAVLKQAGLVECRRQGTQCVYSVVDRSIFDLCAVVCDSVMRHVRRQNQALGLTVVPAGASTKRNVNGKTKGIRS